MSCLIGMNKKGCGPSGGKSGRKLSTNVSGFSYARKDDISFRTEYQPYGVNEWLTKRLIYCIYSIAFNAEYIAAFLQNTFVGNGLIVYTSVHKRTLWVSE